MDISNGDSLKPRYPGVNHAVGPRDIDTEMRMSARVDWREALVNKHHRLFDDGTGSAPGFPCVGDGWSQLVELAIERIADAVGNNRLTISAIKEKYGTLRIYHNFTGSLDEKSQFSIEEAIALAEARSACTCEICGGEGRLFARGDWLLTACEKHARGKPAPVLKGWENVHIVRNFERGSGRIISCRRYIRECDSFEDIPPGSLGISD